MKTTFYLFIVSFIVATFLVAPFLQYYNKVPNYATPDELIPSVLQNKSFRIADLVREDYIIRNKTFDNCHIYGPAVIYFKKETFAVNLFFDVTAEGGLIETTNKRIAGAISIEGCIFRNCTLHKISIIGPKEELDKYRKQIIK